MNEFIWWSRFAVNLDHSRSPKAISAPLIGRHGTGNMENPGTDVQGGEAGH